MKDMLTLAEIARELRVSIKTVQRLASSGELPAITVPRRGGFAYVVPLQNYFDWKRDYKVKKEENKSLSDLKTIKQFQDEWILWSRNGLLVGKPLSENTIDTNRRYLNFFLNNIPRRFKAEPVISLDNLRDVFSQTDPKSFSVRDNTYKTVRSFVRFLIAKKQATESLLNELKKAKPRRVYPAKKLHCTLEQFEKLLEEAGKKYHCQSDYDVLLNVATIATIGFTGLRASELINLRLQDVDLINRKLFVYLGKGKKNRFVGISNRLYEILFSYLKLRPKTKLDNFFVTRSSLNKEPVKIDRDVLLHKIKRLAKRVGFDVNLHGLRRTFATVAANSGKPINIISLALGHADLKTTQGYLMTSQDEVINSMREW